MTGVALDLAPETVAVGASGNLHILWRDGHETRFAGGWLRDHAYDDDARRARAFRPRPWTDAVRANPPERLYGDIQREATAFFDLLSAVRDHGLCFVKGAPAAAGTLEPLARRIGPIQENNFGLVQDLTIDHSKQSVANRPVALKPHTDEPYRASPPGVLMFHCVETDIHGEGASTFIDGFEIAERLRAEDAEGFAALSRNRQQFRRHFADDVDVVGEFPVIALDEFGNLTGVRINDRVQAPLSIPPGDVPVYYRGMRRLLELAEDESLMIQRTLQPGDIVAFDNHRVLHGRTALSMNGRRWLQWVQVERGDLHSALRITADRLQRPRDATPMLKGAY